MKYEVKKGYVKHEGSLYKKGSFFDAEENEAGHLISNGIISRVVDPNPPIVEPKTPAGDPPPPGDKEMTVDEIKKFLEIAEIIDDVEELLKTEQARQPEPRKTAVKLLEEWLKDADDDDDGKGKEGNGSGVNEGTGTGSEQ